MRIGDSLPRTKVWGTLQACFPLLAHAFSPRWNSDGDDSTKHSVLQVMLACFLEDLVACIQYPSAKERDLNVINIQIRSRSKVIKISD